MASPVLQFKRGNIGAAATIPALRPGEPAFTLDKFDLFVGLDTSVAGNKFFGSHRYWKREDATNAAQLRLVDKDGTNFIAIAASDTLAGVATYRLPDTTNGSTGDFLKVKSVASGYYDLEWSAVPSGSFTIVGDTGSDNFTTGETLTFAGTASEIETAVTNNQVQIGLPNNVVVGGALTVTTDLTASGNVTIGTGVGVTQFSASVSTGTSTSSVPTSSAVINYVTTSIAAIDSDDDLGIAGDSGTGTVDLDTQSLTVAGTAGEIETAASGQTITVGLPDTVIVGTALSAPTVKTATIQHSNGTQAATIDTSGNITASQNLTVSGNLYVSGSTTQVNTDTLTVEDRTIELGMVGGSAPGSATTWDLGVLFNYNSSGAKKSAVIWEHADGRFKFGSQISDGGGTDNDSPQITVSNYAAIEIGSLWVNDCAGQSQVINCSGTTRTLENITIDAGTF